MKKREILINEERVAPEAPALKKKKVSIRLQDRIHFARGINFSYF